MHKVDLHQHQHHLLSKSILGGFLLALSLFAFAGCQPANGQLATLVPTLEGIEIAARNGVEDVAGETLMHPPTWTPLPTWTQSPILDTPTARPTTIVTRSGPTNTPLPIPTNTPVTPSPTPSITPTPTAPPSPTPDVRPIYQYQQNEVIPIEAFPRPQGDNGWGMHWIPTVSQEPGVVDHYVSQLVRMHIRWVVFLNDNSNIGDNDYLVERLVDAGIMPVMRVYRNNVLPYDGDLGRMVAHYRSKGVFYFQLYNEPNVNAENTQSFANPNQYAITWAAAARDVINNGGLPGLGAFSPGGAYNHYAFLEGIFRALRNNGDLGLLNRSWLSVHNYHGLREFDDPGGFLLFRKYDEIVRTYLNRSMPMIGTEGGSYHPDPQVEKNLLVAQYSYMRVAEPYFFAFSHWLLANEAAGSWDGRWEFQALFRKDFVHPLVTDFFYQNRR